MGQLQQRLRGLPIRWKIVAMMCGLTAVSLLLLASGLILNERVGFEQQIERKLTLLADVIGLNSTAALAFNDPAAATETLAALSSDDHVMAAALYDVHGNLFARYLRRGTERALPDAPPPLQRITFAGGNAELVRTIVFKGQPIGKMYVLSDTEEWLEVLQGFVGIVAALFAAVLAVGALVSNWLQRIITNPITDLMQLMRRVAQERDYRLRAKKNADDELGVLVDGFNNVLEEIGKGRVEIERAQHELRQLNQDLEQRVLDRTAQLESANKELEAFSYSVSHDLRAPLRAIDGFSRILLDEHSDKLDEAGRDHLDRVRRAAQRMGTLIDDLIKLARVTRTEVVHEELDLSVLANEVVESLRSQDSGRNVRFNVPAGLNARGDSRLLRVVLENLIGNAWKFTGGRDEACIEFGVQSKNGSDAYFVRDNGAGFDMQYAGKLFGAFQRLHTAEEFPGTGIGLATVQRIVRKHGGDIWAESVVNKGTTFYFTLAAGETGEAGHA